jgi:hypothetical protein
MNTLSYNKSNNIYNTNNNIFVTQDPRPIGSVSGAPKRIIIKIIIFIAQIIIFLLRKTQGQLVLCLEHLKEL